MNLLLRTATVGRILVAMTATLSLAAPAAAIDDDLATTASSCADAYEPDRHATLYVGGPSRQVVTIYSDPTDPGWQQAVTRAVGVDLRTLERLISTPMPLAELTVQQSVDESPFGNPDDLQLDAACLLLPSLLQSPAVPAVALARTWFNDTTVADAWLREGLARWSGHRVTGTQCPAAAPDAVADFGEWHDGNEDQAALACSLIADIATRLGPWRMTSVLTAFVTNTAVYGDGAAPRGWVAPLDWRHFLDAVDELGLIRADEPDLEWAERRLVDVGAVDPADPDSRSEVRRLYHQALDAPPAVELPEEVHGLMGAWRFEEARVLIETAATPA